MTGEPEISRAYIGLGSNLGDREETLRAALREIDARGVGRVLNVSSFIETAPWGVTDQPSFLNAAALVETTLAPEELLTALKAIERDLGRAPSRRWGERSIDLDILLYDELVMQSDDLMIASQSQKHPENSTCPVYTFSTDTTSMTVASAHSNTQLRNDAKT